MTVARSDLDPPRRWATGDFAAGRLSSHAPREAVLAQETARALLRALEVDGRPRRAVAQAAGVSRSTLYAVLAGDVYPDFVTIARLSAELGEDLWPRS